MTSNPDDTLLVFCSCPADAAGRLAAALVEQRLAACVSRVPVQSTYRWRGEVTDDTEVLLIIKTIRRRYATLEETLLGLHPYELPEILAVPVSAGLPDYLAWVAESTH